MRQIAVSIGDAGGEFCNKCSFSKNEIDYNQNTTYGYRLKCKVYNKRTKRKQAVGYRLPECIKAEIKRGDKDG